MKRMMKSGKFNPLRLLAGACLLLTMISVQTAARAQQAVTTRAAANSAPATAPAAKTVAPEEQETAAPNSPASQGIKIHGHWVIDLKNPDGTVVDHRDFYNSLVTSSGWSSAFGSSLITGLLSGTISVGGFAVGLITGPASTSGYDVSTFCMGPGTAPQGAPHGISCYGMNTGTNSTAAFYLSNPISMQPVLTNSFVSTQGFPIANIGIVLAGNFIVPSNMGAITAVQTYMGYCTPSNNPPASSFNTANIPSGSCNVSGLTAYQNAYSNVAVLTSQFISSMGVTAGQIISVSVTLTFS